MKRTTIFIEEEVERELQTLARRKGRPVAALVREAVAQYVVESRVDRAPRLRFIAAGRSGRHDVAERHEEFLFEPERPGAPDPRPVPKPRRTARTGRRKVRGT